MKKSIFLLFLFVNTIGFCQNNLISFEQEIIEEFKKDSINYNFIASLSVIDSLSTKNKVKQYKDRLDRLISTLPVKEEKDKREIKRVKKIYDLVHESLFTKYEELAYFPQIFENGVYNCVTATAIYAYVFDAIKVPYVIKDAPGHVFLIAYPKTFKIHLETTAPGIYGFIIPKDSEVKEVVENLIKLKLVTKDEATNLGYDKTYMNYFYGKDFLSKSALIGMQYYNRGLDKFTKKDFKNAQKDITKSLIFFPYAPSKFLNKNLILLTVSESDLSTIEEINKLFDAFSLLKYKVDFNNNDFKIQLYKIINSDNNDLAFIEKTIPILTKFEDEAFNIKNKTFLYEYILDKNANADELDETIRVADTLLSINSKSKIAKQGINYAVFKKLRLLPYSADALNKVDDYISKYEFLKENKKIDSYKIYLFGRLIEDNYKSKDIALGRRYFNEFDVLISKYNDLSKLLINSELIAQIYTRVGRYYYRQNEFKLASEVLNKGLLVYPEDKEIKKIMKWINEETNGKF